MTLCPWQEEDWQALVYAIREKKCILMLGPETASGDNDNRQLSQILANQLA